MRSILLFVALTLLPVSLFSQVKSVSGGLGPMSIPMGELIVEFKFDKCNAKDTLGFFTCDLREKAPLQLAQIVIKKDDTSTPVSISEFKDDLAVFILGQGYTQIVPLKLANYSDYQVKAFATPTDVVGKEVPLALICPKAGVSEAEIKKLLSAGSVAQLNSILSSLKIKNESLRLLYYTIKR